MFTLFTQFWILAAIIQVKSYVPCPSRCTCNGNETIVITEVDCSGIKIDKIPRELPESVKTLLLGTNRIASVDNNSFVKMKHLLTLDLSYNYISRLDKDCFGQLRALTNLKLNNNFLRLSDVPDNVFSGLNNLRTLNIDGNEFPFFNYPDKALSLLVNLENLTIDGTEGAILGPGFQNLTKLSHLIFGSACRIQNISSKTFQNIADSKLASLKIRDCQISEVEPNTFSALRHLSTLDISYNAQDQITHITNATIGLNQTKIEELDISRVYNGEALYIRRRDFIGLSNTHIRILHMNYNRFIDVDIYAFSFLFNSLEYISLRHNDISGKQALLAMAFMRRLRFLDASYQLQYTQHRSKSNIMLSYGKNGNPIVGGDFTLQNHDMNITLPVNLSVILCSNIKLSIEIKTDINFSENNLETFDFSANDIKSIEGNFFRLSSLQNFNISDNKISRISNDLFHDMRNLKNLLLNKNQLGDVIANDTWGYILSKQKKLVHLDLSDNSIKHIPKLLFTRLKKLKKLWLRNNALAHVDFRVKNMKGLNSIDLSNNQITYISKETLAELDEIATYRQVTIDLFGNPLRCTCEDFYVIKWMLNTQVNLYRLNEYTCQLSNGTRVKLSNPSRIVHQLQIECMTTLIVTGSVITFMAMCVLVTVPAILYYKRWQIRYLYHMGNRTVSPYKLIQNDKNDVYHVYLSFADTSRQLVDELEQFLYNNGYHVFNPENEIPPGQREVLTITRGIQNSYCMVVFLTKDYMKTEMRIFEFNLAVYEGIFKRRNMIIPVLLENIDISSYEPEILMYLNGNTFYVYTCYESLKQYIENEISKGSNRASLR